MNSLVDELIEKAPTCYCRIYPVEVYLERRQGDDLLPIPCNPQGENA